jgi:hypothetical protein
MGGNSISTLDTLTSEKIADIVDSLGETYTVYRLKIVKYGICGELLVEYSNLGEVELNSMFTELDVTSGIHRVNFKRLIRSLALPKQPADASGSSPVRLDTLGTIPSQVAIAKLPKGKYHVFLTHDWGVNKTNHTRVSKINDILKRKYGLITWFDDDRLAAGDIRYCMTNGIENSMSVLVFVTKNYQRKVNQEDPTLLDHCKVRNLFSVICVIILHSMNFNTLCVS